MSEAFRERQAAAVVRTPAEVREREEMLARRDRSFATMQRALDNAREIKEASMVEKEQHVEEVLAESTVAALPGNVAARQRMDEWRARRARAAAAVAGATETYQETATPLDERTREIAMERRRLDPDYEVPVGPDLIAAAEEELAAEADLEPVVVDGVVMSPREARRRRGVSYPLVGAILFASIVSFGLIVRKG
jgi:hypothetical protein